MTVLNRCMDCRHEWFDHPGCYATYDACPNCGGLYWQWLDFPKPAPYNDPVAKEGGNGGL